MQGVIVYKDKNNNKQLHYFSGMRYGESTKDFLARENVEYSEIIECNTED